MSSDSDSEETPREYTMKEILAIEEELNKKEQAQETKQETKQEPQVETKKEQEPEVAKDRLPEKEELIEQIAKCQDQIKTSEPNFKTTSKSTMKRYGIPRLQKMLGELINHGVSRTYAVPEQKGASSSPPADPGAEMVANGLFQFNIMFASMAEQLTQQFPSPVVIDKGFSENLIKQRNELLCYYKAIYYEHKAVLDQYISPINMIIIINCNAVLPAIKSRSQLALEQAKVAQPLVSN